MTQQTVRDPDKQLPIDVTYLKLADWLVDRKKIPAEWRKKLISIRNRIAAALASLPKDIDPWFGTLTHEDIGYLEAKRIMSILAVAKPEARTLFGRHSGAAGDWDAIIRAYEKDTLFLGEGAQVMVQNVNYEIPYLRKQVGKIQQQLADLERKEAEYKRNAAMAALRYQQACQELGVKGHNVRLELLATSKRLPALFSEIEEVLCSDLLGQGIDCYKAFVLYAHAKESQSGPDTGVPTLQKLREKAFDVCLAEVAGHQTIDHQEMPSSSINTLECSDFNAQADGLGSDALAIDWDIGVITNSADFQHNEVLTEDAGVPEGACSEDGPGDSNGSAEKSAGGIDRGTGDLMPSEIQWDVGSIEHAENGQSEINWDISIENDDAEAATTAHQSLPAESNMVEGVESKLTFSGPFMKTDFRNSLLDDLLEIRSFLTLRIEEINRAETSSLQNQVQVISPHGLQQYGSDALRSICGEVLKAISLLTNKKTRDLIMLSTSSRFLDRLEASLNQKKEQERKFLENIRELSQKRLELRSTLAALWPRQNSTLERTREIKELCERTISRLYEGRHINIIGEINSVLGSQQ